MAKKKKKRVQAAELTRSEMYHARKEARRRRAREEREHDEALREARKNQPRKEKHYDEQGRRIGDDGLPMTPARTRLHHLCNAYFFLMVVAFLVAVACIALSYFQGQQLTEWELVAYGGTMFHGLSVATMLRVEALFLLFLTACSLLANMKGMAWLYDGGPFGTVRTVVWVTGIGGAVYFVVALAMAQVFEPFSLVAAFMAFLLHRFAAAVEAERPSLKKAKAA